MTMCSEKQIDKIVKKDVENPQKEDKIIINVQVSINVPKEEEKILDHSKIIINE